MHKYKQNLTAFARFRFAAIALTLLVLGVSWSQQVCANDESVAWELVDEHWYAMQMGDLGTGWMHIAIHSHGEQHRTSSSMSMSIARMGEAGEISGESTFLETADGTPLEMTSRQVMSAQAMYGRWQFQGESVLHTSRQGEREMVREVDAPDGVWLTPRSVQRFITERIKADAQELTFRMITPDQGLVPVTVRSKRVSTQVFFVNGKEVPVSVWQTTTSMMPVQSTEYYTEDGTLVYQETPTGMGKMIMRRVTKAEALNIELVDAPVPMLPSTFITPNRPMERAMRSRTATMILRVKEGQMPEIPQAGAQRVTIGDDGTNVKLKIDIDDNLPATEEELKDPGFLQASPMIDSDDSMIRALTRRALRQANLGSTDDPLHRAEALRAFVHEFITNPNLDVPFASASETARTRSGDCSEFGVLLAAMLRADGIPARVASGLVYADQFAGSDNIFGWHMWTQALIDGKWVDLDATLPVRYHAGHVLTGTSSLADGQMGSDMASLILLIGNLEIEIVEVGY